MCSSCRCECGCLPPKKAKKPDKKAHKAERKKSR